MILSIISIQNAKSKLKNYNRSKPEILRLLGIYRFQIGFVFVEYDLFNTTNTFITKLNLYFISISRDRNIR